MLYLTAAAADVEQQASTFSRFLQQLTWQKALPALLILAVSLVLIRVLTALFDKAIRRSKIDPTIHPLLRTVLRTLLTMLAMLMAAGTLGIDVSVLVAVLSVLSLAVSLAVQGTLSNVIGGLVILTAHPFRVGDYVDLGGTAGTVQRIGLTYTDLRTPNNQDVHVPNSQVSAATVTNYTAAGTRRMELFVSASYGDDPARVKAALLRAAEAPGVLADPAPEARLNAYQDSAIQYVLRAWAPVADYWDVCYAVLERIRAAFAEAGVTMPFPQLDVHQDPK